MLRFLVRSCHLILIDIKSNHPINQINSDLSSTTIIVVPVNVTTINLIVGNVSNQSNQSVVLWSPSRIVSASVFPCSTRVPSVFRTGGSTLFPCSTPYGGNRENRIQSFYNYKLIKRPSSLQPPISMGPPEWVKRTELLLRLYQHLARHRWLLQRSL